MLWLKQLAHRLKTEKAGASFNPFEHYKSIRTKITYDED